MTGELPAAQGEARYRALVDSATDAIVTADVYGTITEWNPAAEQLFGYGASEAVGCPVTILMPERFASGHPQSVERFRTGLQRRVVGTVVDLVGRRKDGSEFPIELSLANWEVAGERYLTAIIRDVSERERAAEALRASEQRYRVLYENSPIAIELYDAEGRLVEVNPACLDLFGVVDESELRTFDLFADPNVTDDTKERLRRGDTVRYVAPFDFDTVTQLGLYRTSRSGTAWLDVLITPIGAAAVGYLVLVQEITSQRRAEEALRAMHERLELAQRAAGAGMWDVDIATDQHTWSPELYALFGLERDRHTAGFETWAEVVHPEDRAHAREAQETALRDGSTLDVEYRIVLPSGEVRWVHSLGRGDYGEDGRPLRMSGLAIDVTESHNAREEIVRLNADLERRVAERTRALMASNEELEAFAYSVSHDLRAPLRTIDGFSRIVLEDEGDALSPSGRDDLERVRAGAQRMGQLIDALLAVSRLSRRELDVGRVDLSRIAEEETARLAQAHPERRVTTSIAPGCVAEADADLVGVVLANLLGNAWKFTAGRDPAHIEFGSVEDAGRLAFYVRDDGAGFEPAYAGKLFNAFQRLHPEGEYPGTGIGLATVRRIVTRLGGRCWADGEPGRGATFYFTLAPLSTD